MTSGQKLGVVKLLSALGITEVHHGDCVGSDSDMHDIAWANEDMFIIIHPPVKRDLRAWRVPRDFRGQILEEKTYLARDRDIVDATDILIATSHAFVEEKKSGTWYTMNYARQPEINHTVYWVTPDGGVRQWKA